MISFITNKFTNNQDYEEKDICQEKLKQAKVLDESQPQPDA